MQIEELGEAEKAVEKAAAIENATFLALCAAREAHKLAKVELKKRRIELEELVLAWRDRIDDEILESESRR